MKRKKLYSALGVLLILFSLTFSFAHTEAYNDLESDTSHYFQGLQEILSGPLKNIFARDFPSSTFLPDFQLEISNNFQSSFQALIAGGLLYGLCFTTDLNCSYQLFNGYPYFKAKIGTKKSRNKI